MNDLRFFFYDEETTGLSPEFDQILQIAAVITDQNFNVLETINLRCRLKDYIVPSHGALTTTGVAQESCTNQNSPNISWPKT